VAAFGDRWSVVMNAGQVKVFISYASYKNDYGHREQGAEHGGQVCFDRLVLVVVDRPGQQVVWTSGSTRQGRPR